MLSDLRGQVYNMLSLNTAALAVLLRFRLLDAGGTKKLMS